MKLIIFLLFFYLYKCYTDFELINEKYKWKYSTDGFNFFDYNDDILVEDITTYFKGNFIFTTEKNTLQGLVLTISFNLGIVLFINGELFYKRNINEYMNKKFYADHCIEKTDFEIYIPAYYVKNGVNIIRAEIHKCIYSEEYIHPLFKAKLRYEAIVPASAVIRTDLDYFGENKMETKAYNDNNFQPIEIIDKNYMWRSYDNDETDLSVTEFNLSSSPDCGVKHFPGAYLEYKYKNKAKGFDTLYVMYIGEKPWKNWKKFELEGCMDYDKQYWVTLLRVDDSRKEGSERYKCAWLITPFKNKCYEAYRIHVIDDYNPIKSEGENCTLAAIEIQVRQKRTVTCKTKNELYYPGDKANLYIDGTAKQCTCKENYTFGECVNITNVKYSIENDDDSFSCSYDQFSDVQYSNQKNRMIYRKNKYNNLKINEIPLLLTGIFGSLLGVLSCLLIQKIIIYIRENYKKEEIEEEEEEEIVELKPSQSSKSTKKSKNKKYKKN